jgi:type I restriction enzyme S subunit
MSTEANTLESVSLFIVDCLHSTAPIVDEGYPLIRTPNVGRGRLELTDAFRVTRDTYDAWTRRAVPRDGDLILAREAPAGNVAIIKNGDKVCLGQRTVLIRPDAETVDPDFLCYYLLSPKQQAFLLSGATGVTAAHVNMKDIRRLPLHGMPSIDVQRRSGSCLCAYDDLIENNRRRMALLERAVRLLYEEWFVRLRFPGHEHVKTSDSPLGRIPAKWELTTLGDITTKIGSGATPRGGEASYQYDGIALIRSQNVYNDRFEDDGLAYISDAQADELANVSVEARDILLNITGASVARCCMVPKRHLPARVNQHVMIIRPDATLADPYFVLAAINSEGRKRQLLSYAQVGGTREALTKDIVTNFRILLPSKRLLQRFGEIAGEIHQQLDVLADQNAALRNARDLLLPRLMSGEIAV